jgi:hypothetical protein
VFGIQSIPKEKHRMNEHMKRPTMTDAEVKKELMNDSLGTIDTADSTGSDETKETGDSKRGNTKTRED